MEGEEAEMEGNAVVVGEDARGKREEGEEGLCPKVGEAGGEAYVCANGEGSEMRTGLGEMEEK